LESRRRAFERCNPKYIKEQCVSADEGINSRLRAKKTRKDLTEEEALILAVRGEMAGRVTARYHELKRKKKDASLPKGARSGRKSKSQSRVPKTPEKKKKSPPMIVFHKTSAQIEDTEEEEEEQQEKSTKKKKKSKVLPSSSSSESESEEESEREKFVKPKSRSPSRGRRDESKLSRRSSVEERERSSSKPKYRARGSLRQDTPMVVLEDVARPKKDRKTRLMSHGTYRS